MLVTTLLLAAAAPVSSVDAFAVFQNACVNGEAKFAPGTIRPTSTRAIPNGAKKLVGLIAGTKQDFERPKVSQLPARAFVMGEKDEIFLLPPNGQKDTPAASLCAVFVRGDHYSEFASKVANLTGDKIGKDQLPSNRSSYNIYLGKHVITAARENGWTMLASLVDSSQKLEPQE